MIIKFARSVERKQIEIDNALWFHGDMKACIAKYTNQLKKLSGEEWTYKDFVRLSTEKEQAREKLTLKKAKESLGSKFKLN